jgi:hypothetical protein
MKNIPNKNCINKAESVHGISGVDVKAVKQAAAPKNRTPNKKKNWNARDKANVDLREHPKHLVRRIDIEDIVLRGDSTVRDLGNLIVGEWGLPVHPVLCPVRIYTYEHRLVAFHTADYMHLVFSDKSEMPKSKINVKSFCGDPCVLTAEQFGTVLGFVISREIIIQRGIIESDHEFFALHKNSYEKNLEYRCGSRDYNRFQD